VGSARAEVAPLPLRLELLASRDSGLGTLAGVLSYDRGGPWSLGAAVGVSDAEPGDAHLHLGLLGRLRLLGSGRFSLGLAVAGSHADRERRLFSELPAGGFEIATWRWQPGWRLDAGLEAGLQAGSWVLRLGGGVGILDSPRLDYEGPCGGDRGPTCLDYTEAFGTPPGQVAPYFSVSAAWQVGTGYLAETGDSAPDRPLPDPRGDWGLLAPAALTVPQGSYTLTFRQLVVVPHLQLDYGLTDRVQIGGGLGVAFPSGEPVLFTALAKARILGWQRLHVGVLAGYFAVVGRHFDWQLAGVGPVTTICLDSACASFASVSLLPGVLFADPDEGEPYREYGAVGSGGVVYAVTRRLKLIGELHLSAEEPAWIAGLRITFGRLGLDIGVANLVPLGSLTMRL
jgi:hypothetical protein